jgi:hypothetical protein
MRAALGLDHNYREAPTAQPNVTSRRGCRCTESCLIDCWFFYNGEASRPLICVLVINDNPYFWTNKLS